MSKDRQTYLLRMRTRADLDLWARFKSRAEAEGIPMRALILLLVEAYADGTASLGITRRRPQ